MIYYTWGDGSGGWHSQTMKHFRTVPQESLKYIIWDCQRALEAMPDNPKAGQYQDEILYAAMELNRRKEKRVKTND